MPIPDVVRDANKRLAFFGLFRVDDLSPLRRYRFRKGVEAAGPVSKLNAQSFFDAVRPELRFRNDPSDPALNITIGDLSFRGFQVLTPADAVGQPTKSMPLLKHSHLLGKLSDRQGADGHQTAQLIGGDLLSQLVHHLDRLNGLDHPHFTRALIRIVHAYLPGMAEQDASTKLTSGAALQRQLVKDLTLRGQLLKYLLCLEDDEAEVRSEVTASLARIAGGEDSPFHPSSDVQSKQISLVVRILAELKERLYSGSEALRKYLKSQIGPWIGNDEGEGISLSEEYDYEHPETGKGKDFFAIYYETKKSSDWVARFMRTEVLHSYVFCWLASKYLDYNATTYGAAAQEMFRKGVQSITGRIYAESRRALRGYLSIIDDRSREAVQAADESVRVHLGVVKERLKLYFLPSNAYTREKLLARATRLFVSTNQLAGGMTEEIHKASTKFSDELYQVYQPLLEFCSTKRREGKTTSDAETQIKRDELIAFLKNRVPAREAFVTATFASAGETDSAKAIKERFIKAFTDTVMKDFKDRWGEELGKILEEEAQLKRLFGLWCGTGLEARGDFAGLTHLVSLDTLPNELFQTVGKEAAKQEQLATLKASATAGAPKQSVPLPLAIATELSPQLKPGAPLKGKLFDPETNREYGSAEIEGKQLRLSRADGTKDFNPAELSDAGGLQIVFDRLKEGGETEQVAFNVVELKEIPVGEMFPLTRPGGADSLSAASEYDTLVEKLKNCHKKYRSTAAKDAAYRRMLRALKLTQVCLAAPRGQINLDAKDLSNNIGVILEVVEKMGDPAADLYGNGPPTDAALEELLKEVNLSEVYPLADEDITDMDKILAYHHQLCRSLTSVAEYLGEVRELRDFLDAIQNSTLDVEVVNRTLADYAARALDDSDDLFLTDAPLAVYVSRQGRPDEASVSALDQYLRSLLGDPAAKSLQLPCVFLAPRYPQPDGAGIPVVTCDDIRLPDLTFIVGAKRIQQKPFLLWIAALLGDASLNFGEFPKDGTLKKPMWLNNNQDDRGLPKLGLPAWDLDRESVVQFLRKAWKDAGSALIAVSDQLVLLKLLNYGLVGKGIVPGQNPNGLQDVLTELYGPTPVKEGATFLYQTLFQGLPIGQEKFTIGVREVGGGAFNPAESHPSPVPGTEFQINGRAVKAPWTANLSRPGASIAAGAAPPPTPTV